MAAMAGMADKSFDLAIVDPPYGLNAAGGGVGGKYLRLKLDAGTFEIKPWDLYTPPPEYFTELQRVSNKQIIWGGNFFNLAPMPSYVIWDKGAGFRDRSFAECELAWLNWKSCPRIFTYDPLANRDYVNKVHPTQKPITLYKWLLTNYAKQGDKILDTHLGSGSSRIAAYDLGFDFTGYELDKDYFDAQEERFANHIAQPKLFAPTTTVGTAELNVMPLPNMTNITPPPDRETIEREIHSLFKNGDLSDIARLLQKDQSLISKEFNPYSDEKHNVIFQAILRLWAMDAIRPDLAPEVLNIVLREREKWLPVNVRDANPTLLTCDIITQFNEFLEAELSGKGYEVQIKEIQDVINAAEKKRSDIIAKSQREKFGAA